MRPFFMAVAGILVLAAPVGAAQPERLAGNLWNQLAGVSWNSAFPKWNKEPSCKRQPPQPNRLDAEGAWCFQCRRTGPGFVAVASYYAFDPDQPACRLLQFRASTGPLSQQDSQRTYRALLKKLEENYGPGKAPGEIHGQGAAYWRYVKRWDVNRVRILLFVNEVLWDTPARQPPRVELLAQHERLRTAIAQDQRLKKIQWGNSEDLRQKVDAALAGALRGALPKLGAMLESRRLHGYDAGTVRVYIEILLKLSEQVPVENKPVYLMAADRLAGKLGRLLGTSPGRSQRDKVSGVMHGNLRWETSAHLCFQFDHIGGWVHRHGLLRRVWEQYGNTRWGEYAFLLLQQAGWFFGAGCPEDPATFRPVIRHGEAFLQQHPESPHRLDVVFALAQAYDTWWSVSQPKQGWGSDVPNPALYRKGAARARQQAIHYYEIVRQELRGTVFADYAERQLPRLKLGFDTGQRRFLCMYD